MDFSKATRQTLHGSWLDLLIAIGVLLFGLYWLVAGTEAQGSLKEAVIYKDNAVIERIGLAEGEERRIDLSPHGVAMVVAVRQGRVRVISSSCPQQVCVRKGWVGQAHDPIICIPNKVIIEVTGTDPQYDAISR
jgi:hypothetical protein